MTRVVIKLKDGTYINTAGDYMAQNEEGYLIVWNGADIVAIVLFELVSVAYLTEKNQER